MRRKESGPFGPRIKLNTKKKEINWHNYSEWLLIYRARSSASLRKSMKERRFGREINRSYLER
jgi:hypothetical protein